MKRLHYALQGFCEGCGAYRAIEHYQDGDRHGWLCRRCYAILGPLFERGELVLRWERVPASEWPRPYDENDSLPGK